ncbi:hypothetical protein AVEN_245039-1 [Araneus ventricosus]|uniref:Uncharacterized protein n=1 Tax=Araneus ventricosus TaxID=182803 RepID=A0A4Y2EAF4_ARAVE|nr:hypothetical protein AVEN_245039-1 [Araneus ventricosus]
MERLIIHAYAECPQEVRDSLAAQYFVDAIRDEDTQHPTRLMDAKDLEYSMKVPKLLTRLPEMSDQSRRRMIPVEKEINLNFSQQDGKIIENCCCWEKECFSTKSERDLLEVQQKGACTERVPGDYAQLGKLT